MYQAPDQKNAYGEEGSWHADRVAGNLIYFYEILGCRVVGDVHFSNKPQFNHHRHVYHNLPPIGKLPTKNAKSKYNPAKYAKVRFDINKVLQRNTNNKHFRLKHEALTKYRKKDYHELPQEVKDDIEQKIEEYNSTENRKLQVEKREKHMYIKTHSLYIHGDLNNASIQSQVKIMLYFIFVNNVA